MKQKRFATLVLTFIVAFTFSVPHFALFALGDGDSTTSLEVDISPMAALDIASMPLRSGEPEPHHVLAFLRLYLAHYIGLDTEFFLHGDWTQEANQLLDQKLGIVRPQIPEGIVAVSPQNGRNVGFFEDGSSTVLEDSSESELPTTEVERLNLIREVLIRNNSLGHWIPNLFDSVKNVEYLIADTLGFQSFEELLFNVFTSPVGSAISEEIFDEVSRVNRLQRETLARGEVRPDTALAIFLQDSLNNSPVWSRLCRDLMIEDFLIYYENGFQHFEPYDSYESLDPFLSPVGGHRRITATSSPLYRNIVQVITRFPNGATSTGTGFLIAPHVVLTAGHNLHHFRGGGWATNVTVTPGRNGLIMPFGHTTSWQQMYVGNAWVNHGRYGEGDWGLIILNNSFHVGTTFFNPSDMHIQHWSTVTIMGYLSYGQATGNHHMYHNSGTIRSNNDNLIRTNFSGGVGYSGAPMFIRNGTQTHLLGIKVMSNNTLPPTNHATGMVPNTDEIQFISNRIRHQF